MYSKSHNDNESFDYQPLRRGDGFKPVWYRRGASVNTYVLDPTLPLATPRQHQQPLKMVLNFFTDSKMK